MKSLRYGTAAFVAAFLIFVLPVNSASPAREQDRASSEDQARSFTVRPATSKIMVDGVLDEQAWADAASGDLPYEWLPGDNVPAPVETEFLITFSTQHLYIAMRCFDPEPERIRAHLMDRDEMD